MPTRNELLEEQEWRKCRNSFEYFASTYWKIKHPAKGCIVFGLRDPQRTAADTWLVERLTVNLKARQIGWTTLAAAFAFWAIYFHDDRNVVFLSRGEREAAKILAKVYYGYDRLPTWMRTRRGKPESRTTTKFEFTNHGGIIESLPSKKNAARGESAWMLVVDEYAFIEDQEEAWASIEPASDVGGRVVIISTANGYGDMFHDLYAKAKKGENDFVALFFPWNSVPERDAAWFEAKCRNLKPWQREQEYPTNDEECFVRSGNTVFDLDTLQLQEVCYPELVGYLEHEGFSESTLDDDAAPLWVWREPEPGRTYAIGADIAEGLAKGDYSCAHVIDVVDREVVAIWHGHIEADLFGDELYRLGRWYNWALLGPERNNHGHTTIARLRELRYPKLFTQSRKGRRPIYGWQTDNVSKAMLVDDLARELRDAQLKVNDQATVTELSAYTRKGKGNRVVMEGLPHDDRVMSLGIAVQMMALAKLPRQQVEPDPVEEWSLATIMAEVDARHERGAAPWTRPLTLTR